MTDRAEFVQGLREFADFLEEHEDAPLPSWPRFSVSVEMKEQLVAAARAMGKAEKYASYGSFYVKRGFGPITYAVFIGQEEVCHKVVKGQKWVAETLPTPGRWVEDVEWVCDDPLLRPSRGESDEEAGS